MNTKDIAKRVASAHLAKTASSDRNFFSLVDKNGWRKIRTALQKDGDTASVKLWDEASQKLAKELEMPSSYDVALTKMMNLVERGPRDPEMTRNQVFKIADLLGIKLPHSMFASVQKQAGYSHYWEQSRDFTNDEWSKIARAAKAIVRKAESKGIAIRGGDGNGKPVINGNEIVLNGDEEAGEAHETFDITKKQGRWAYCKTARKPYDAVVVSILAVAKKVAPDAIDVDSDGGPSAIKQVLGGDKQAKHKVGLPPYGSWRSFVDFVQLREAQHDHKKSHEDIKHALGEIRQYAATSGEHARGLKAAYAALVDAQNILHEQDKLGAEFNKQMNEVYKALKKVNQL